MLVFPGVTIDKSQQLSTQHIPNKSRLRPTRSRAKLQIEIGASRPEFLENPYPSFHNHGSVKKWMYLQ